MLSYPQAFEHAAASFCLNFPLSPLFAGLTYMLILDLILLPTSPRKPLLDVPTVPCADSCANIRTLFQQTASFLFVSPIKIHILSILYPQCWAQYLVPSRRWADIYWFHKLSHGSDKIKSERGSWKSNYEGLWVSCYDIVFFLFCSQWGAIDDFWGGGYRIWYFYFKKMCLILWVLEREFWGQEDD